MLSQQAIKEFKEIYERRFNKTISNQVALKMATELLTLIKVVYQPAKGNENEQITNSKKQGFTKTN